MCEALFLPQNHSQLTWVDNGSQRETGIYLIRQECHRYWIRWQQATIVDFRSLPDRRGAGPRANAHEIHQCITSNKRERMKKTRRCACCGREFTAYSGVQRNRLSTPTATCTPIPSPATGQPFSARYMPPTATGRSRRMPPWYSRWQDRKKRWKPLVSG